MCGYRVVEIKSDGRGNVDLEDLAAHCDERVAGMMLTNPNTLGLFDENVIEVAEAVHRCGGLVYGDGANFNAIMGIVKPADVGFDVMHFNLHKTFSTPHGGGGPGSGPVGVTAELARFLPGPVVEVLEAPHACECQDEADHQCGCAHTDSHSGDDKLDACSCGEPGSARYYELAWPEQSVGQMKAFYGNFGVLVRAYAYIRTLGATGLREASETAVLNANYLRVKLQETYPVAVDRTCMHEFVLAGPPADADESVHTMDVAKRLIDLGHAHPPTVYFPLIVPEAMMIEPTETESKETLDRFVEDMSQIAQEARTKPNLLHEAPRNAPVRRLDEVQAARRPILRYEP
jgi:glycine dehydrogenase subunit 2